MRKKNIRRIVTYLIIFSLILSTIPNKVFGGTSITSDNTGYVWLEGEDSTDISGGYFSSIESNASGGKLLKLWTQQEGTIAKAGYSATIPETGSYDIWILATDQSQWLSAYKYKIDAGEYKATQPATGSEVFQSEGMPYLWHKLETSELSAGVHSIDIQTDQPRTAGDGMYIQGIDAIAVVPSTWNWTPNGLALPEKPVIQPVSEYVWLEGEDSTDISGGYFSSQESNASGGKLLKLWTKQEGTIAKAGYSATIPETGSYDVWILATEQSQWLSAYKYKLDSGEYKATPLATGSEVFRSEGMPYFWHKLETSEFGAGVHSIDIQTDQQRTAAGDGMYIQGIDAVAIVPSSWEWSPYGLSQPFNKYAANFDFVSGSVDNSNLNREDEFDLTFTNRANEDFNGSLKYFVEIVKNDEVVLSKVETFKKINWKAGDEETNIVKLKVPFNAPGGNCEIRTGIMNVTYSSGEAYKKVTDIKIGVEKNEVQPLQIEITDLKLQPVIEGALSYEGKAVFELCQNVDFDTKGYLSFYKDNILWYVAELGAIDTSSMVAGQTNSLDFSYGIPNGLPAGNYEVMFGIHKLEAKNECTVQIQANNSVQDKYYKPLTNGTFKDKVLGQSHFWYANQSHTMIWDGEPFIPVGGMFLSDYIQYFSVNDPEKNKENWAKDLEILEYMKLHGVKDLYINQNYSTKIPKWAWQWVFDYLNETDMRYGFQINGIQGTTIEQEIPAYLPRTYDEVGLLKVGNITESGSVKLVVPNTKIPAYKDAVSSLFVVVNDNTGDIVNSGEGIINKLDNINLEFTANVNLQSSEGQKYTVYFTPKIKYNGYSMMNVWDAGEFMISNIKSLLSGLKFGPNFRFFVDPINNESGVVNENEGMLIDSPVYRSQFVDWLKIKYKSIEELNQAWKMITPIDSYEKAARLVPIVLGQKNDSWRNKLYLIDSEHNDAAYIADAHSGILWDDFVDFRENSYNEYQMKTADEITSVVNCPVVYKHTGNTRKYFINDKQKGGFQGIGGEVYGDNEYPIRERSGYAYDAVEQAAQTMWYLITETQLDENMVRKYQSGILGYTDKEIMHQHFNTLIQSGAKGIYDFLFNWSWYKEGRDAYAYWTVNKEQFDWLKEYRDKLLEENSVKEIEAFKPKVYYVYPSAEMWWNINRRQAVIPNNDYRGGAVLKTLDNKWVIPTFDPTLSTDVLVVNLEDAPATTLYGAGINKLGSLSNGEKNIVYLGYRKNLGALPQIDKYFTDSYITLDNGAKVQQLNPNATATTEVIYKTSDNKVWGLRDGKLFIITDPNWIQSFDEIEPKGTIKYLHELNFDNTGIDDVIGNVSADPGAGTVEKGTTVTLSTTTEGAIIYYTLDGSDPQTSEQRQVYSSPIAINEDTTVKAYAAKEGMLESDVSTYEYKIKQTVSTNVGETPQSTVPENKIDEKGKITLAAPVINAQTGTVSGKVLQKDIEDSLNKVKEDSNGQKTVVINVSEEKAAKQYLMELPSKALSSLGASTRIELSLAGANITFPGDMLKSDILNGAESVVIGFEKKESSNFDDSLKKAIGDRTVIDLSLKINGKTLNWRNENTAVTVTMNYKPTDDELKNPDSITVWYIDDSGKPSPVYNARYNAETGTVTFTTTHFSTYAIVYNFKTFKDSGKFSWAQGAIESMASKGIMSGVTEDSFGAEQDITRAEFIDALIKATGLSAAFETNFSDVSKADKYYNSVGIAKKLGITSGTGNNQFNPANKISRQDMSLLLVRAMEIAGMLKTRGTSANLEKFADAAEIRNYATISMATLVKEGILAGDGAKIDSAGNLTKAQTAVIMKKLYNK